MKNVFISERLAQELPDWVPYLLWYAIADHWEMHGERQVFELTHERGMQRIRHTQDFPPYENALEFPCPEAVDAVIVVRISKVKTVMMLAEEENNGHNRRPGIVPGFSAVWRRKFMFDNPKYLTRGVQSTIPGWLVLLMWSTIEGMQVEQKDYLQVFRLQKTERGQRIWHEQEQPPYLYQMDVPCTDAVDAKIFVIDDGTHSTMLLADEY